MGLHLKLIAGIFTAGVALFAYSEQGCASSIAQQTCDTEVWKTMTDRAHIETEREIMQNQNLIFKPDSILAYTCFDNFAAHASLYVGQLFTHTKYWNGKLIIEWGAPYGMDNAMQKVVIDSMKPYIEGSFKYSMLGGRGEFIAGTSGGGALSYKTPQDIGNMGRTYSCDVMNNVWKAAKCLNFIHNSDFEETDGFYPFIGLEPVDGDAKIKGYDEIKETRVFPTDLTCAGGAEPIYGKSGQEGQSSWEVAYRDSRNETEFGDPNRYYQFGEPLDTAHKKVREKVELGKCHTAILTGVQVLESPSGSAQPYADGVCTNPGCIFVKNGMSGSCQESGKETPSTDPADASINQGMY
jgi:hypothetical protein